MPFLAEVSPSLCGNPVRFLPHVMRLTLLLRAVNCGYFEVVCLVFVHQCALPMNVVCYAGTSERVSCRRCAKLTAPAPFPRLIEVIFALSLFLMKFRCYTGTLWLRLLEPFMLYSQSCTSKAGLSSSARTPSTCFHSSVRPYCFLIWALLMHC